MALVAQQSAVAGVWIGFSDMADGTYGTYGTDGTDGTDGFGFDFTVPWNPSVSITFNICSMLTLFGSYVT